MKHEFTLEFGKDDRRFVGKLKEVPGIFSQGASLQELEENIAHAYQLMTQDDQSSGHPPAHTNS